MYWLYRGWLGGTDEDLIQYASSREQRKFPEDQRFESQVKGSQVVNLPRDNLQRG